MPIPLRRPEEEHGGATAERIQLGDGWTAEIYREWSFPPEVRRRWNELAAQAGDASVFVGYDWFAAWWEAFGADRQLFTVALARNGTICGIFPCCLKHGSGEGTPNRVVSSLTNPDTCHFEFLFEERVRSEALAGFLEVLRRAEPRARLSVECLPARGGGTTELLREARRQFLPVHHFTKSRTPWTSVADVDGSEPLDDRLPPSRVKDIRRCRKRAQEQGGVHLEVITGYDQLDRLLDDVFEVEQRGWKGRDGTAIRSHPETERFYRRLAHSAMESQQLLIYLLRLRDRLIAADLCLRVGRTVYLVKTGYDESFRNLSPGNLLRYDVLEHLMASPGVDTYNLLGDCDSWKLEWSSGSEEYRWITLYPPSVAGWWTYLVENGWKDFLKQFAAARRIKDRLDRYVNRGRSN